MSSDKEVFILSVISGWLGAIAFLLSKEINAAQQEQQRAMEDARIRFEHQKDQDENGGRDIQR
jgi:uncharacterized membrane-anchored protein YhcB (DUF1043 family)